MAATKKLSTLIIDAVVDTKGIDRAVGSINGKLKGIGGSGGGGAGAGQFRAGMTPYGMQFGSSAGAAAAAAAFGASAGRGGGGGGVNGGYKQTVMVGGSKLWDKNPAQNWIAGMGSSMIGFFEDRQAKQQKVKGAALNPTTTVFMPGTGAAELINAFRWKKEQRFNNAGKAFGEGLKNFGNSMGGFGRGMSSIGAGLPGFGAGPGKIGALGAVVGIGTAAAAINNVVNFGQRMSSMFADKQQFKGTAYENIAAQIRSDYKNNKGQSIGQSIFIGARGKSGRKSMLEKVLGAVGTRLGKEARFAGAAINAALGGTGEQVRFGLEAITPGSELRQTVLGEKPGKYTGDPIGAIAKAINVSLNSKKTYLDMFW